MGPVGFQVPSIRNSESPILTPATTSGSTGSRRKIIAWGGTTANDEETGLGLRGERRVWFHDLSAGPEAWTDNWNVDDADVDGDGLADYRLPPTWEYLTAGGYRAASAVTADLALRDAGSSPSTCSSPRHLCIRPTSPLRLPGSINLDVNTYEGWSGVDASQTYQTPALLVDELTELHPIPYTTDQQDLAFKQGARNCYQLWLNGNACYPNRPYRRSRICFSTAPSPSLRRETAGEITKACCSTT